MIAVAIVGQHLVRSGRTASAETLSPIIISASADATMYSDRSEKSDGSADWIRFDASPERQGLFKFDVPVTPHANISHVSFQCWAGSSSTGGAELFTTSSSWREDSVSWADRTDLAISSSAVGATGTVVGDSYVTIDVTGTVTEPGTYSFLMTTRANTRWSCQSRTGGSHPPRLNIALSDSDNPVPTASSSSPSSAGGSSTSSASTSNSVPPPASSSSSPAVPPATSSSNSVPPPASSSTPVSRPDQHKMLVILGENRADDVLSQMPTLAGLGKKYGQATNYAALTHPSLPNYLAIFGGSTFGVTSDCSVGSSGCVPSAPSVFGQTVAAGKTAMAYQESMSSNCQTSSSNGYVARHGPWPYWTDATERSACQSSDVPSGNIGSGNLADDIASGDLPVTGELTPNLCNDAHDCSAATFDQWLAGWLPQIMGGPDYQAGNLTIVITFDEDDGGSSNQIAFVVVDPNLSGRVVTGSFNHYSLTRWLDDNAGVARLRNAASAPDLRAAFGLAP